MKKMFLALFCILSLVNQNLKAVRCTPLGERKGSYEAPLFCCSGGLNQNLIEPVTNLQACYECCEKTDNIEFCKRACDKAYLSELDNCFKHCSRKEPYGSHKLIVCRNKCLHKHFKGELKTCEPLGKGNGAYQAPHCDSSKYEWGDCLKTCEEADNVDFCQSFCSKLVDLPFRGGYLKPPADDHCVTDCKRHNAVPDFGHISKDGSRCTCKINKRYPGHW